jgi:hypothetical protein
MVATFSDGSRGPLPDEVVGETVSFSSLAQHEVFDNNYWLDGLFVLGVDERTVSRVASIWCDYEQEIEDVERILQERWQEYLGWDGTGKFPFGKLYWKRNVLGEEYDDEATEREIEAKIDRESYFSVTPLETPQRYSL